MAGDGCQSNGGKDVGVVALRREVGLFLHQHLAERTAAGEEAFALIVVEFTDFFFKKYSENVQNCFLNF